MDYNPRMAKESRPQTYRVSDVVDAELRQLAKKHGGIDKSLRVLIQAYDSTAWRRLGENGARAKGDKRR